MLDKQIKPSARVAPGRLSPVLNASCRSCMWPTLYVRIHPLSPAPTHGHLVGRLFPPTDLFFFLSFFLFLEARFYHLFHQDYHAETTANIFVGVQTGSLRVSTYISLSNIARCVYSVQTCIYSQFSSRGYNYLTPKCLEARQGNFELVEKQ